MSSVFREIFGRKRKSTKKVAKAANIITSTAANLNRPPISKNHQKIDSSSSSLLLPPASARSPPPPVKTVTFKLDDNSTYSDIFIEKNINMTDETTSLLNTSSGTNIANTTTEEGNTTNINNGLSWSQSLLSTGSSEHNDITTAAFILRDAIILSKASSLFAHTDYLMSTNPITISGSSMNVFSKISRKILTNSYVTSLLSLCIVALVAISFLEPPTWCREYQDSKDPSMVGCEAALYTQGTPAFYVDETEDKIQFYYPSVRSDYLNVNQAFVIESAIVVLLCVHTLLCIVKDGFSLPSYLMLNFSGEGVVDKLTSTNMKNIRIFRMLRITTLLLLAKGLLVEALATPSSSDSAIRPFAIFLRIFLFISYSEGVQRELMIALEIIPSLLSVGVVLFMVIAFYGMIGVAAFYGTKEGELHFSNWVEGCWTLWTSMTTVIYPDVMMAGYNENRFVALYFITFMMFTFFFLLNVILAIVANGYNSSNDARENDINETRTNYTKTAFDLITKRTGLDYVSRDQVMAIFLVLNEECDEILRVPERKAEILFEVLDQDGSEHLHIDEFMNFTTVMLLEFSEVRPTWLGANFPSFIESENYQKYSEIIASAGFDYAIDIIVLLNAIVVIVQSYPELAGHSERSNSKLHDGMIDTPWEIAETLFTFVYVIEMISKILVFGWKRYSSSLRNLFDGFITVLAVGSMILVYYPNDYSNSHLIRFVVMSRVVRVFRLFMTFKPFTAISKTFIGVLPAAGRVALLLFCVMYTFSAIGMHLFGGLITRDPANPMSYVLEGTDFANNFYWANNFNDILSGMNVCFNLLVINNWNEMETGILAISSKWSRYFFFSFFICGVIIVNNLVVAIVIDYFFSELEAAEMEGESKTARSGLKKLRKCGKQLYIDGEKLPQGKLQSQYVASMRPGMTGSKQKLLLSKLVP